jgi:two-component system sensor histidine kinase AlgZ
MSTPRPAPDPAGEERGFFLPDFCAAPAVLAIVAIAALLGVVLALARQPVGSFWADLARTSAFLLWTGLLCAAVLCRARPWLARVSTGAASALALTLMVATVAVVSLAVYGLGQWWEGRLGETSGLFPERALPFLLPNVGITLVVGALALRYFYVASQWRRSVELEARARTRALQARIRPHFLYNSLNAIASLTRSDPPRAERAIEDLADLFRVNLGESRAQVPLAEEIETARMYQRIEQLRLGDRLHVRWETERAPVSAVVPSLLLQPLLENAIGHGVEPLPGGGTVTVRVYEEAGRVVLEVDNPVDPQRRRTRPGNRMALDNIRQRLELAYPAKSSVEVVDSGHEYRVRLRFPVMQAPARAFDP